MRAGSKTEYLSYASLFGGTVQMSATRSDIPGLPEEDDDDIVFALEIFMRGSPDVIYRRLISSETEVDDILLFASDLSKAAQKLKKELGESTV